MADPNLPNIIAYNAPAHMQKGLLAYLYQGRPPGGFLAAVLQNDLWRAALQADATNARFLAAYGTILNAMPQEAWGSQEAVKRWIKQGGLEGAAEEASYV